MSHIGNDSTEIASVTASDNRESARKAKAEALRNSKPFYGYFSEKRLKNSLAALKKELVVEHNNSRKRLNNSAKTLKKLCRKSLSPAGEGFRVRPFRRLRACLNFAVASEKASDKVLAKQFLTGCSILRRIAALRAEKMVKPGSYMMRLQRNK